MVSQVSVANNEITLSRLLLSHLYYKFEKGIVRPRQDSNPQPLDTEMRALPLADQRF